MSAPFTLTTAISNAVNAATARGITDAEQLARIRQEAIDRWYSDWNSSFSGKPRGSSASN